jgi:hypothetical protein
VDPHRILPQGLRPHEDILDEVYEKYAHSDPFLPLIRFVDHATMGPEALVALGRGDKVPGWVAHHQPRPYTPPRRGRSIEHAWHEALGRRECHGDWLAFFAGALESTPFSQVLAQWVPRFIHEVDAWLFHGLIRTAHAVRALDHHDTRSRRDELMRGLSLWAIGVKHPPSDHLAPDTAERALERDVLGFARAGAATFIATPNIPNVHLVTGPMAYAMIMHHLDVPTHRAAAAAFRRTHARALRDVDRHRADAASEPIGILDDQLFGWLAKSHDAHPIKLTEAALRGYAATNDEIFLQAIGKLRHLHGIKNVLGIARAVLRRAA